MDYGPWKKRRSSAVDRTMKAWHMHKNTGYEDDCKLDEWYADQMKEIVKIDKTIMSEKEVQDIEQWLNQEEEE